jgi:hypothetical protein
MVEGAKILIFEPDLLFSSKLDSSIRNLGDKIMLLADQRLFLQELTRGMPKVLVLNLDALEGELGQLRDTLGEESCVSVGCYSHTNTRLAKEAKRAGISVILPRGAFVSRVQEILEKAVSQAERRS